MTPPSDSLFFSNRRIEVHVGDYREVIPRRLDELGVEPRTGDVRRYGRGREAGGSGRGWLVSR